MPSSLALFLTFGFVAFLFRRDFRQRSNVTGALWLPVCWVLISASRPVSGWLSLWGFPGGGGSSLVEGSPVDATVYSALLASGVYVLVKRRVRLSEVIQDNAWLTVFFVYCFLAVFWSDFPIVALKRWVKILGHPIMALILFTEPDPEESLIRLIKRCAYIIVPFSVLFIKYYPQWGREFDPWTGQGTFTGITTGKNALGRDCLILGFFLVWHMLNTWRRERGAEKRKELLFVVTFLVMIGWLLRRANSATSLLCMIAGSGVMLLLGLRFVSKKLMGVYVVTGILALAAGELMFGLIGSVIESTGHGETFSGRQDLWRELLAMDTSPILGAGFESFWLGDRLKALWANHWWHPTEAHNGYLELYLSLGLVGVLIVVVLIISTFRKISVQLATNFQFARARMGMLVAIVLYNWTEATFKAVSLVWFVFYIISLDYRRRDDPSVTHDATAAEGEPEMVLAYPRY